MVFTFKLRHLIPQTATSIHFKDPIPTISQLEKFGLRPEYFELSAKSLRKNVESSAYAV